MLSTVSDRHNRGIYNTSYNVLLIEMKGFKAPHQTITSVKKNSPPILNQQTLSSPALHIHGAFRPIQRGSGKEESRLLRSLALQLLTNAFGHHRVGLLVSEQHLALPLGGPASSRELGEPAAVVQMDTIGVATRRTVQEAGFRGGQSGNEVAAAAGPLGLALHAAARRHDEAVARTAVVRGIVVHAQAADMIVLSYLVIFLANYDRYILLVVIEGIFIVLVCNLVSSDVH